MRPSLPGGDDTADGCSDPLPFRPVKGWLRRHAVGLATVLAVLVVVLGVVVVVQARMLLTRGWGVPLGNVAEWVGALGTLATFGAVFYAAREWRAAEAERRDRAADQARLIVTEPTTVPKPDPDPPELQVTAHNQSGSAVLDMVLAQVLDGELQPARMMQPHLLPYQRSHTFPLPPGVEADAFTARNYFAMNFTDAAGRRWCRVGRGQPVPVRLSPIGRQIDEHLAWLEPGPTATD